MRRALVHLRKELAVGFRVAAEDVHIVKARGFGVVAGLNQLVNQLVITFRCGEFLEECLAKHNALVERLQKQFMFTHHSLRRAGKRMDG